MMDSPRAHSASSIWSRRFARFNDWSPARKILLIFALILPAQLAFKVFFDVLTRDMTHFSWLFWPGLGAWAICIVVSLVLVLRGSTSTLPYMAAAYVYGSWLIAVTYYTGWLDSSYSMYVVIGIMLFALVGSWRAVWHWLALWSVATVAIGLAQHHGWLAYGPLYVGPMQEVRSSTHWLLMNLAFLAQMVAISLAILWLVSNSRIQAVRALNQSYSIVRRYLPPSVAEQIIAGDEASVGAPTRRRVTILFADIAGFTDIADRVEPEVMTEVLSDYMSRMAQIIEGHDGTLNEFAGDGLMALFGAPKEMPPEAQALLASRAAIAMHKAMDELNAGWRKLGLGKSLSARIGINTGLASVGSYGSLDRMTYTAIGLQTNIASRIETHAQPGETLISDASYQLVKDQLKAEPRGDIECKGVHFPVAVFAIDASQTQAA